MVWVKVMKEHLCDDVKSVLYDEEKLKEIVSGLAKKINEDYKGKDLVVISVLKGSFIFASDLVRLVDLPIKLEFMVVSSYEGTESTGKISIIKDVNVTLKDKHVLLIEDIFDTGRTLSYLVEHIKEKGALSTEVCTLFYKPARQKVSVPLKYVGAEIPDEFIVGYGLDYNEIYRNLPYVGILNPEVYGG